MFRKLLYFPFKTCWDIVTRIIKSIKNCADFSFEVGRFEIRKYRRKVAWVLPELLRFVNNKHHLLSLNFDFQLPPHFKLMRTSLQKFAIRKNEISKSQRLNFDSDLPDACSDLSTDSENYKVK